MFIVDAFLLKVESCGISVFPPSGLKMLKSIILTNVEAIGKHGILMLIHSPVNVNC